MEPRGIHGVSFSRYSPAVSPVFLFSLPLFFPLFFISGQLVYSFAVSHPSLSSSLNHVSLPCSRSSPSPPLLLHLLYCKQLTKSMTRSLLMFPRPPSLFSQLFVIVSLLSCVFVSITLSLFCFFPLRQKSKS